MLIEAALTTVIIGVAVVALLAVMGAGTRSNAGSRDLVRAIFLAQEVREMLAPLPMREEGSTTFGAESGETSLAAWDDLDDFNGRSFSPPVNAQRQTLSGQEWSDWRQQISVESVDPNNLAGHLTVPQGSTDFVRVTVRIYKGTKQVHQMSWLVADFATQDTGN
ncbi:MAG: hypothetical protein BIFFINMI_03997 [Phycisphaerae bacterium]|nr:hypothetical protein [Phycisphaerae bacterium]